MVEARGIEPRLADCEPAVIPLDHAPKAGIVTRFPLTKGYVSRAWRDFQLRQAKHLKEEWVRPIYCSCCVPIPAVRCAMIFRAFS